MSDDAEKAAEGCAYGVVGCAVLAVLTLALGFGTLGYFGFVQRGGVYDGLRVQLAQSQLNQLVPYVELYRIQRGYYPESIDQLSEVIPRETPLSVSDPSSAPLGQQRPFFYERVGADHYILRGVGADGAPYTNDDIVPQGFDANGIGLLLARPPAEAEPPPVQLTPTEQVASP